MDIKVNTKKMVIEKTRPPEHKATNMVVKALRQGVLKFQPCVICGDEWSIAHHEDYNKPLEIVWLCRKHHMARHKEMNNGQIWNKRKLNGNN